MSDKRVEHMEHYKVRLHNGKEGYIEDTGNDYKTFFGLMGNGMENFQKEVAFEEIAEILEENPNVYNGKLNLEIKYGETII